MDEDLKQYMTNLLYHAHIEAQNMSDKQFDKWVEEMTDGINDFFYSDNNINRMKELINKGGNKRTPLVFKCKCGAKFISNEWNQGLMLPSNGVYPSATDKCPACGEGVRRGSVYRPLINSAEYNKWIKPETNL
jgi:hypothetical protein